MHRLTWHMEHGGMPAESVVESLEKKAAGLIDRNLGPATRERRATGVPRRLLPGHPMEGGFGALATREHVQARWACWAVRIALSDKEPANLAPWQAVLASYLKGVHPAYRPWAVLTARAATTWPGTRDFPPDIQRIVTALACLPPVIDVEEVPLAPGTWCRNLPIWGNPLLPVEGERDRPGLELRHPELVGCHALRTVGDVVRTLSALRQFVGRWQDTLEAGVVLSARAQRAIRRDNRSLAPEWEAFVAEHLRPTTPASDVFGNWGNWHGCNVALVDLCRDIPEAWVTAAGEALGLPQEAVPSEDEVVRMILPRLGWRLPEYGTIRLRELTVRLGLQLQLRPCREARSAAHERYVKEALGLEPLQGLPNWALEALRGSLRRLWQSLKWENANKEIFWRLAVDGVPLPGNSHMRGAPVVACGCGSFSAGHQGLGAPRQHHFWHCPVAQAVVGQVEARAGIPVARSHLWLASPPAGFHERVWDVVSLAALSAMEVGRRYMAAELNGPRQAMRLVPPWLSEQSFGLCPTSGPGCPVLPFWSFLRWAGTV